MKACMVTLMKHLSTGCREAGCSCLPSPDCFVLGVVPLWSVAGWDRGI